MYYKLLKIFKAICKNTRCGTGAICSVIGNSEVCSCPSGSNGDPTIRCCGEK